MPRSACAAVVIALLSCACSSAPAAPLSTGSQPPRLWLDGTGTPTPDAYEALALLRRAAGDALDPDDYQAAELAAAAADLASSRSQGAEGPARFDSRLTLAMVRYLHDLHSGRVDPRAVGFAMDVPDDNHDFAAIVRQAVAEHRIVATAAEFTPAFALYRALRSTLVRYRALAADTALEPPIFSATVRPGDSYDGSAALRRLMIALGDLPADTAVETNRTYGPSLVQAVERFQRRHGLDADGIMGRATQGALRVPLAARVRQLELAMERLRWLPHPGGKRLVAVNVPMFRLWAWDPLSADDVPSFNTGVIVGRAVNTQTPLLVEEMQYVIFRPYWNIPRSILLAEILPAVRRDQDYLRRQNMEIVSGSDGDVRAEPLTPEALASLERGVFRLRQRPGPENALGLVKFVFPNDQDIYLHGTPAPRLFESVRRDFSHGCLRVEDPVALAEWMLKDRPEWTRDRIVAAMQGSESIRVNLRTPIRVILFYVTAVVMPEDGTVHFADDIYGHDLRLAKALAPRPPP